MSSKYDNIQTAAELVSEVMIHGLSTEQEDICRAQDIFGNSTLKELVKLANDIGRNNEDGEPDPKGTWSSNRKPTQGTFYMIASSIWNWEEVTRFWNLHTNPEHEKYNEMLEGYRVLHSHSDHVEDKLKKEHESRLAETNARLEAETKAEKLAAELHDKELEVMELKAKLYDLMMKENR